MWNYPAGITVDASGIIYVSDSYNHCIRTIAVDNTVNTWVGLCGTSGTTNGVGTAARLFHPWGLKMDQSGNIFLAGNSDMRIRKIEIATATVSTFAGSGVSGSADGQGTSATFSYPLDVAFNASGYLFVADGNNDRIRVISPSAYVSTFAGSNQGFSDGQGANAKFYTPNSLVVDDYGYIWVADRDNNVVRKISPSGLVTTPFSSKTFMGDQRGPALKASFIKPVVIELGNNGVLYVGDNDSQKLEIICSSICSNGVMNCATQTCTCDDGWLGNTCNMPNATTTTTSKK
jgi:hypothetical protein